jgi:methyl-accepting chemotaxis protein
MAHSLWSDRPLGVKLTAIVAAGAAALGVFAVITVQALQGTGERAQELLATTQATGEALEADMMHDAVRADVLQALLNPKGSQYESAAADLADHSGRFREILGAVADQHVSTDVDAAVAAVTPLVEQYLTSADAIMTTIARNPAQASAAYPDFLATFSTLEDELPSVGAAVETAATDAVAATDEQRGTAITLAIIVAAVGVLVLSLLGFIVTRSVVGPLRKVGAVLSAMAEGDLRATSGVESRDEVGRMAAALETSMANVREVMTAIGDSSTTLASATEELSASAQDMARLADESSAQSAIVASAAGQVSTNVQTVSAGSEQMGASIREIAQNATEATKVAQAATGAAASAHDSVSRLGSSSQEIGKVVKLITSIAEQTNLLALNATIEAARAGEPGKGYAVVAGEVKELASETAKATEDIARRVEAIQADTTGAVAAIGEIGTIIASINDYQLTIASAVEEQTATTNEMSRGVAEAATGSGEIAANITGVATSAATSSEVLSQMGGSVTELARMSADLRERVSMFTF